MRRSVYLTVALLSLGLLNPQIIYAISPQDRINLNKGITRYDSNPGCDLLSTESSSIGTPILSGETVTFPDNTGKDPGVTNSVSSATASELSPQAIRGAQFIRYVGHKLVIGGIRADPGFPTEHPAGNSLDIHSSTMGNAVPPGDEFDFLNSLAETLAKNHKELSVSNVIWNNRIISERDGFQSWRPYSGGGSGGGATIQHKDHIHVKFTRVTGSETIKLYGTLKPSSNTPDTTTDPGVTDTEITEGGRDIEAEEDALTSTSGCECGPEIGTGSTNLRGNDKAEQAFNYFIDQGYSPEQSAGIVGNFVEESAVMPNRVQGNGVITSPTVPVGSGKGYGIAQWTDPGRQRNLVQFAADDPQNRPVDNLHLQLDFVIHEMKGYNSLEADLKGIRGGSYQQQIDRASRIFHDTYERSADNEEGVRERTDSGIEVYEEFVDTATTTGSTGFSIVNSDCSNARPNGEPSAFVDNFPVYAQYDPKWANKPYSSSTIGASGCGPAAMAMIITALTGETVTPVETSNYAASKGMYIPGQGSLWTISPTLAENWGLKSRAIPKNQAAITEALQSGALVITAGQGPKPFTSGGHFIVIRAVTDDGKFKVGDSGHSDTSDKEWEPRQLLSSMSGGSIYAIYK